MKRILPLALAVLLLGGVGVHHYQNQLEPDEALAKGELLSINQLKIRQIETLSEERLLAAALAGMLVLTGLLGYAFHTRLRYLQSRRSLGEETERRLAEEPKTLEELSQVYGVSRERVRQIEVRAFEKLQKAMMRLAGDRRLLPA